LNTILIIPKENPMRFPRIYTVALLCFLITGTMLAQEETLLGGGFESGGYGAPVMKFTSVKGDFAFMMGGYGGWLINHSFMIGGGGYGLVTTHRPDQTARSMFGIPEADRMEFGYGGGVLEFIFHPMSVVHSSVSLLVGAGEVSYTRQDEDGFDIWSGYTKQRDRVFVLEPSVNIELNVTTFFRVNAGGSYRYVSGVSMYGLKNKDLSGPSVNIALKFGAF
jgi:hypothetical protein